MGEYTAHLRLMRSDLTEVCVLAMAYGCHVQRAALATEPGQGQVWVAVTAKTAALRDTVESDLRDLGLVL